MRRTERTAMRWGERGTPHATGLRARPLGTVACAALLAAGACGGDGGEGQMMSGTESASSGIELDSGTVKLDVGGGATATGGNGGDCPGGGGMPGENEFSIIWIANSPEGTVSKIDTATATELARYRTGPDDPDPSRTTVNLQGDVAVANRSGSITKIASVEERCVDNNQNGMIDTSQGPNDVLPWGEDECVLWHHDIPFMQVDGNQGGPRGTAWDAGDDAGPCQVDPDLWIGWRDQPNDVSIVRLIDGATGAMEMDVTIDNWLGNWGHGPYGGAADADGAYWGLGTLGTLIRIDPVSFDVQRWDNDVDHVMYGIAMDANGDPWLAGWDGNIWWFDRSTEQFVDMGGTNGGPERLRGLMVDQNGEAWIAGNNPCALVRFDTVNKTLVDGSIDLPGCDEPVGVSIDVDGMVWVVDRGASVAYKVDPDDLSAVTVQGLVSPYTYSDMTGAGLGLVVNPPAG